MSEPSESRAGTAGDPLRRSLEVEYWVVDERGRLTEPGDLVDAGPGVEREFVAPLLEVKTSPCASTEQLRAELFDRLERVLDSARERGKRLVPLGTPAHAGHIEDRPSERIRIQDRVVGSNFEHVRHCAGTHIHVEQQPGREIDQLNTLIALDPALALVNSSPYYGGEYVAAGARTALYRWRAYDGIPHQGELWRYAEDRVEWAKRLERRYGEFVTEAVMAGLDRETVESCFDPESAAWTPVKLRAAFSTVEWRSPDTALPSQVVKLADDVAGIMEHLDDAEVRIEAETERLTDDAVVLPSFDTVQNCVKVAVDDGLESGAVRAYLDRMGFDVSAYEPISHELDEDEELSVADARELRLAYADRLEQDIRRQSALHAD